MVHFSEKHQVDLNIRGLQRAKVQEDPLKYHFAIRKIHNELIDVRFNLWIGSL